MAQVAQGYCTNHPEPMAKINGPDGDVCLICQGKRQISGGTDPNAVDPGEEKMRAVLSAAGVNPGKPQPKQVVSAKESVTKQPLTLDEVLAQALSLLEHAPMPKDIKQFKLITKIMADLKKLVGE